ncbi:MAG: DUF3253 domain-containing protein [Nitriliruptoraceae bacterium]
MAPLPEKLCASCGRRFAWRRAWARDWEQVRYCSDSCRRRRVRAVDHALEAAILDLLGQRAVGATICPSEAARRVAAKRSEAVDATARPADDATARPADDATARSPGAAATGSPGAATPRSRGAAAARASGDAEGWRALMEPARRAARRLVARGEVELTQDGRVVDPSTARGPVRIRRVTRS